MSAEMQKQTLGEFSSKLAAVGGGFWTALTVEQALGIGIAVAGMAATWWLAIMRNRREFDRQQMEREEHEARMALIRRGESVREIVVQRVGGGDE